MWSLNRDIGSCFYVFGFNIRMTGGSNQHPLDYRGSMLTTALYPDGNECNKWTGMDPITGMDYVYFFHYNISILQEMWCWSFLPNMSVVPEWIYICNIYVYFLYHSTSILQNHDNIFHTIWVRCVSFMYFWYFWVFFVMHFHW